MSTATTTDGRSTASRLRIWVGIVLLAVLTVGAVQAVFGVLVAVDQIRAAGGA